MKKNDVYIDRIRNLCNVKVNIFRNDKFDAFCRFSDLRMYILGFLEKFNINEIFNLQNDLVNFL